MKRRVMRQWYARPVYVAWAVTASSLLVLCVIALLRVVSA